ncbi:hypothetical protein VST7929_02898 [Vibrio stylophorae]|uniref:N-acetyltransferase domain-containing protein n=1 Tax=Vibrio stylophorae TaxID=659351 RepID=A0ABM8ZX69_9VIBR|nr:GNAT family N-acetyltransferase [Vibrio stylophorae]CAH0535266.1 hypothetical protein VST7929_02898 [Vibrio stylophorae]
MHAKQQSLEQQAVDLLADDIQVTDLTARHIRIDDYIIRPLTVKDNAAIAAVIRIVSAEYGLTPDKGYGVADPTLDDLFAVYSQPRAQYWVIEWQGQVIGGAGYAPLSGAPAICELQKMYFLPKARGCGLAKQLAALCFAQAKADGFTQCYLETTACLGEAVVFYERLGFRYLAGPLGSTGHDACEIQMILAL